MDWLDEGCKNKKGFYVYTSAFRLKRFSSARLQDFFSTAEIHQAKATFPAITVHRTPDYAIFMSAGYICLKNRIYGINCLV